MSIAIRAPAEIKRAAGTPLKLEASLEGTGAPRTMWWHNGTQHEGKDVDLGAATEEHAGVWVVVAVAGQEIAVASTRVLVGPEGVAAPAVQSLDYQQPPPRRAFMVTLSVVGGLIVLTQLAGLLVLSLSYDRSSSTEEFVALACAFLGIGAVLSATTLVVAHSLSVQEDPDAHTSLHTVGTSPAESAQFMRVMFRSRGAELLLLTGLLLLGLATLGPALASRP